MKKCFCLLFILTIVLCMTPTIFGAITAQPNTYYYDSTSGVEYYYQTLSLAERKDLDLVAYVHKVDKGITHIEIPESMQGLPVVGLSAFNKLNETDLVSITFPNTFIFMKLYDFNGSKIQSIHIPASVIDFSSTNLSETAIKSITVDENNEILKIVGNSLYSKDGKTLYIADISNSGSGTFTVQNGITTIGNFAFASTNYSEIILPNTVNTIYGGAFSHMYNLEKVNIPEGVTLIGGQTFLLTEKLKHIDLPSTLTYIGEQAFCYSGLESLELPNSIIELDRGSLNNLTEIKEIVLPMGLTEIPYACFLGCRKLETIHVPSTVTKLADDYSWISYGYGTFEKCSSLRNIYFYGDAPTIAECSLNEFPTSATIYCLEGKSGWSVPNWNGVSTKYFTDSGIYGSPGIIEPTPTPDSAQISFTDVPTNHWAYSVIEQAVEYDIVKGVGNNKFNPNGQITRAECVTIAARLLKTAPDMEDFPEKLPEEDWFIPFVDYLTWYGIFSLDESSLAYWVFDAPNTPVTREEFVMILSGVFDYLGLESLLNDVEFGAIPDLDNLNNVENVNAIYKFYRGGILSGMDSKLSFKPNNNLTRAEACAVAMRLIIPENRIKF